MKYTFDKFYSSINKMPRIGDEKPTFYAVVDVTVPTGGYNLTLVKNHVDGDVIYLRVDATPPSGIGSQAFETHHLRYEETLDISYKRAVLLGPVDETDVQETQ